MLIEGIKWWKHQIAEFNWMLEREVGILNAGMGTGKTLTTLWYLDHKKFSRTLIVTTGKGIDVWKDEIDEKLVKHPTVVDHNKVTIKSQSNSIPNGSLIYLTTYARLWREPLLEKLIKSHFDIIILDESHYIAANNSKVSKAAAKLGETVRYRFCLTGTLLTNSPLNIFGQARFVDKKMFNSPETPNLLNSFTRFREHFCYLKPIPGVLGGYFVIGYKNMDFYESVLNKHVFRVDSDKVLDLPEAVHRFASISMPSNIRKMYWDIKDNGFYRHGDRVTVADNVLVVATRLQQLSGGFLVTSDPKGNPKETTQELVHTAKLDALEELVEGVSETDKIVVFARFTEEILHIAARLKDFGGVSILSGTRDELKEWQGGKTRIIVVQTDTGSEAIDLSQATYTFIYSTGWSLSDYEQMLRRMRRPRKDGTKAKTVFYYHLLMRGTIDTDIDKALRDKQSITNDVLRRIVGYNHD